VRADIGGWHHKIERDWSLRQQRGQRSASRSLVLRPTVDPNRAKEGLTAVDSTPERSFSDLFSSSRAVAATTG